MANFYVTHHLYPENPQLFTVNVRTVVKSVGEPGTDFHHNRRGETYWEISINTSGVGVDGAAIPTLWLDVFDSEESIDEVLANGVYDICSRIDWSSDGTFYSGTDTSEPKIEEQYPANGQVDVPINSTIRIVLKEDFPGLGIDKGSIDIKVNGVPITPVIVGNPYRYIVSYTPRVLE